MIRNVVLLVILLLVLPVALPAQPGENDTIRIYQLVAGNYEYYSDLQYYYFDLHLENGMLLFKELNNRGIHKVIPVDLANLKFKISDSVKEKFLYFEKNSNGESSLCRLITNGSENLASKKNLEADTLTVADKVYSPEALRADLTQIKDILINNHPAIYQFTSEELFAKNFTEQINKIDRPMNMREFYLIAAPIVESVQCGHTSIRLPDEFWKSESQKFFPIILTFIEGKAYVNGFYDGENVLPSGSEILSVNKISITEIIKSTKEIIEADGNNQQFKLEMLKLGFPDLYNIVYGFYDHFVVDYIMPESKLVNSMVLNGINRQVLRDYSVAITKKNSTGDPNLDVKFFSNKNLAVITIKSFYLPEENEKFYSFIDKAFEDIKIRNIQNLILDLRSNQGGKSDRTSHLLSYIESKPVLYFDKIYTGYTDPAKPIPLATKNSFSGKLIVLINGACFSATSQLCSVLKFNKIGTLIGEETGSTFECNSQLVTFNTKETRMILIVAQITFTTAVKGLSREDGILPDYVVLPKLEDLIKGKDTVKEFAYKLIEKSE
jgi:hypothetical protein